MSLSVIAPVFLIVALAELPDSTMVTTVMMATRYRPLPIWIGASIGFILHSLLAVAAGRALDLLPHRMVEIVVAVVFAAGAIYLLVWPDPSQRELAEPEEGKAGEDRAAGHSSGTPPGMSSARIALTAFGLIGIGELGDLTQVLTMNLAARYHDPWSVFTGSAVALLLMNGAGILGGRALARLVPVRWVRRVGGAVLAVVAVVTAVSAAG
jgi:putative Ca2+/H+ antiporter (TMEM165/GDT1 family)